MRKKIRTSMFLILNTIVLLTSTLIILITSANLKNAGKNELQNKAKIITSALNNEVDHVKYLNNLNIKENNLSIILLSPDSLLLYKNTEALNTQTLQNTKEKNKKSIESGGKKYDLFSQKLENGNNIFLAAPTKTISSILAKLVLLILAIISVSFLLAVFSAKRLATDFYLSIKNVDFNNPINVYDELTPFVRVLAKQKKKITKQLASLEKRRATIDIITRKMKEGVLLVNNNGVIIFANKSAKKLLNVSTNIEAKTMLELTRDIEITKCMRAALEGENCDTTAKIADRTLHIVFSSASTVGVLVLIVDITARVKAEELRREFSANVSHELKTPLTTIHGYAEMLENNMVRAEDISTLSKKIKNESNRLIFLIDDIIRLSKLDETTAIDNLTVVDLAGVARLVAEQVKLIAENASVEIRTNLQKVEIHGNHSLIFDMIYNLVENSVKYNKPNGTVTIDLFSQDENAVLKISDTGIGIPDIHQKRIFERFYRAEPSRSVATGGTGLGLSIVKHIVLRHKGLIELTSKENEGTTITVTIPKAL